MRKQAINSSSLRIAVRKNYSLLLVKISLFAFASVAIAAKHFILEKNGMSVEIQLRTQLQHIWTTSVEAMIFLGKHY